MPVRYFSSGLDAAPNSRTSCGSSVRIQYGWLLATNGANTAKNPTNPIQISPIRAPVRPTVSSMTCASHGVGAAVPAGTAGKGSGIGCAATVDILRFARRSVKSK